MDAGSGDEDAGSGELGSLPLSNPMRDGGVAPGITQVITSVPQVCAWQDEAEKQGPEILHGFCRPWLTSWAMAHELGMP
jgi:hypothetical protein